MHLNQDILASIYIYSCVNIFKVKRSQSRALGHLMGFDIELQCQQSSARVSL